MGVRYAEIKPTRTWSMREPGSCERPWSASISSAIYETINGRFSVYDVSYLQDRACRLVRGERANLVLAQCFPQCHDTLLCDFTEFGRMPLFCASFALVRVVTKDGGQWTLPCLPRRALPRAHKRLRLMRGRRVEEMWAEEEKERADHMRGELVHYEGW
jgi:hypothetical protein